MPIRPHLPLQSVFEPEDIHAMATAFELACADLHIFPQDELNRDIVATRIIDLARTGVMDAAALHRRVVAEAHVPA